MNKYIATGHYYIPTVRHELDKIINYPLYLDIDLTNAFHQILLHPDTMNKLSEQTPWKQLKTRASKKYTAVGTTCKFADGTVSEITWTRDIFWEASMSFAVSSVYVEIFVLEGHIPKKCYALHWKTYIMFCWGERLVFYLTSMILVDEALAHTCPRILKP